MTLWKAADKKESPVRSKDIVSFGWTVEDMKVTPKVAKGPIDPEGLTNIISCKCSAVGKACSSHKCSCYKEKNLALASAIV